MHPTRYSIRSLFRCFLLPSYLLLVYLVLCYRHLPKAITPSDSTPTSPFSFTAYIPLSSRARQTLNILLEPFTSIPAPQLKELVLFCPEDLFSEFRLDLEQLITQESHFHPDLQLNYVLRPLASIRNPQLEVLRQASEASTDWVLILDEHGIDDIKESTLRALQDDTYTDFASPGLQAHNLTSPFIFLNETVPWISTRYWRDPYVLKPPLLLPTSRVPAYIPLQDTIVFLLPDIEILRSANKMICGLIAQNYILRVLVYDPRTLLFATSSQTLKISLNSCPDKLAVHQTTKTQESGAQLVLFSWLNQSPSSPRILFSVQEDQPLFEGFLSTHETINTTRIYIPRDQYSYTDWIGSLSVSELQNWHIPKLTFSVITQNRPHSLRRLLHSLSSSLFFGDTNLNVRINVDFPADNDTKSLVQAFSWPHGPLQVYQRIAHGGLLPAIVESWYPHTNDTYGLLLEDDIELSPLFYAWIKMSLLKYRYGTNKSPNLFGVSLYQQKHLELPLEGRRPFNARAFFSSPGTNVPFHIPQNTPYLSSIPCSWGAVYFPEHWREFHDYLARRLASSTGNPHQDIVPNVRSNKWSQSWKKFFIELVYLRGYVMLYPNYAEFASLSTNHLEAGLHVRGEIYPEKRRLFMVPLMQLPDSPSKAESPLTGLLDLPEDRLPDPSDLPVLNLTGSLITLESLVETGQERVRDLDNVL
ncbi:hypothetical protein AN958_09935 [Leucoagaricus sp. SymC.cos]|nr:hypothetical protein AN958_09935 [Leucoagaricus sp. SymC.cos]